MTLDEAFQKQMETRYSVAEMDDFLNSWAAMSLVLSAHERLRQNSYRNAIHELTSIMVIAYRAGFAAGESQVQADEVGEANIQ